MAEAVATVFALAGVALTSTKTIYETIASVREGSDKAKSTANSLINLRSTLELVRASGDHPIIGSQLKLDVARQIKACLDELKRFDGDIKKIQKIPTDSRGKRVWKAVLRIVGEKKLEEISQCARGHATALSLYLDIITNRKLDAQTASFGDLEDITRRTHAELNAQLERLELSVHTALMGIEGRLAKLPTMSPGDLTSTQFLLETLQRQTTQRPDPIYESMHRISQQNHSQNLAIDAQPPATMDVWPAATIQKQEVLGCINRLMKVTSRKPVNVSHDDAESILSDLETILRYMREEGTAKDCSSDLTPWFRAIGTRGSTTGKNELKKGVTDSDREIKQLLKYLAATDEVALNSTKAPSTSRRSAGYNNQFWYGLLKTCHGDFEMTTSRSSLMKAKGRVARKDQAIEILRGSVKYKPNAQRNYWMILQYQQLRLKNGAMNVTPSLTFSKTIPDDHPVFNLIRGGNINGLIRSFQNREASYTDRDVNGRSLLNYAIHHWQPEIVKYLLKNGADVAYIEKSLIYDCWGTALGDCKLQLSGNYRSDECMKACLEAGADPTLPENFGCQQFPFHLRQSEVSCDLRSIRVLLDHGREWLDIDSETHADNLLVHLLLRKRWKLNTLRLLVERGFFFRKLERTGGFSVLHHVLLGSQGATLEEIQQALCILIDAGANVHALDEEGLTVSGAACQKNRWYTLSGRFPFRPVQLDLPPVLPNADLKLREIWRNALIICGRDADVILEADADEYYVNEDWDERPIEAAGVAGLLVNMLKIIDEIIDETVVTEACKCQMNESEESSGLPPLSVYYILTSRREWTWLIQHVKPLDAMDWVNDVLNGVEPGMYEEFENEW